MLKAENPTLTYIDGDATRDVVSGVSIMIKSRQFNGILGLSGSGKSSLLYLLSGLVFAVIIKLKSVPLHLNLRSLIRMDLGIQLGGR